MYKYYTTCISRGQKFHLLAHNYEQNLEKTSNSSQITHPKGQVLKSEGETSIFQVLTVNHFLSVYGMQLWNWLGKYYFDSDIRSFISHIT